MWSVEKSPMHWCITRQINERSLDLVGYEDEDVERVSHD
jgi:hypothetical protein